MVLTAEQLERIAENKRKAEEKAIMAANRRAAEEKFKRRQQEHHMFMNPPSPIGPPPTKKSDNFQKAAQSENAVKNEPINSQMWMKMEVKPHNMPPFKPSMHDNPPQPSTSMKPYSDVKVEVKMVDPRPIKTEYNRNEPSRPVAEHVSKVEVSFLVVRENGAVRLKISHKPFHSAVSDAIRKHKTALYCKQDLSFSIQFSDYKAVKASLLGIRQTANVACTISDIPSWVPKIFADEINGTAPNLDKSGGETKLNHCVDSSITSKLFPYQKQGVLFGIQKEGRLLIADEMGLGKTIQAIGIARAFPSEWPLLIVCPSSVKYSWKAQLELFVDTPLDIRVIEKGSDSIPSSASTDVVIIMSYDLMCNKLNELLSRGIHDESHMIKESKAQRTKCALRLAEKAKRRILLSGTPALSRPRELFSQIRLVDKTIFPNYRAFTDRYCDGKFVKKYFTGRAQEIYDDSGTSNSEELSAVLFHTMMIRRLKADVLKDLPKKVRQVIYLSGSKIDNQIAALRKLREGYLKAEKMGDHKKKKESMVQLYSETGMAKADAVADHVLEVLTPTTKLLVFAHHQCVLDSLETKMRIEKIQTIRIDGATKSTDRGALCDRFQKNPNVRVAILSITAAGTGITLTAANKVIFAELHWNPGTLIQAEDRAHRVGQKDCVCVEYILAKNSADDHIWPLVQQKLEVLSGFNLNDQSFGHLDNMTRVVDDDGQAKITDFFEIFDEKTQSKT